MADKIITAFLSFLLFSVSAHAGVFIEPFGGFEFGNVKEAKSIPPVSTSTNLNGGGIGFGGRLGVRKSRGKMASWGIGGEYYQSSLLTSSGGGVGKPSDIGAFIAFYFGKGFRWRVGYLVSSKIAGLNGNGFKTSIGFLPAQHLSLNFDFIARKANGQAETASGTAANSTHSVKTLSVLFSVGFPLGEGLAMRPYTTRD